MQLNIDNIEIPSEPIIQEKPKIPISQILSDENITIENILNYPTILDEFNSKNEELLKYFQKDKIKILIDFIIKEPEEDNFEKGHKFPFLCCEIFKSGNDELLNQFFFDKNQFNLATSRFDNFQLVKMKEYRYVNGQRNQRSLDNFFTSDRSKEVD